MTLGGQIKSARKARGWSHEDLANALDGSPQTVMDWEAGRRTPPVDRLVEIAKVLERPVGWFFEGDLSSGGAASAISKPHEPVLEPAPSEKVLLDMLAKQQLLLTHQQQMMDRQREDASRFAAQQQAIVAEQQAMMERQRSDVARLTELLANQQDLYINERQFQQKLMTQQVEKLQRRIEELEAVKTPRRGRQQLLEPPVRPGRAGEG